MKYLLLLISFSAFAWNPTEIKVITCQYGASKDVVFTTSQKQFSFNRVFNDRQVRLDIKDTDKFSEVDDYMVVSDFKGHKITYSLKCSKVVK